MFLFSIEMSSMSAENQDIIALLNKRDEKGETLQEIDDDILLKMANDEIEQLLKDLKGASFVLNYCNHPI